MRVVVAKFREITRQYPVTRGMASYTVIWPVASLLQQRIIGSEELNYTQALRFSIYGGFFVAPTLYCWLKCASYMWPKSNLRSAITKALVEQVTYGPAAMCCFFFGINLLEFKSISECFGEVREKFWPTYKVGVCVWPFLQTINFLLIPEKNRVVYVSFCSLMWTSFLAYMKSLETKQLQRERERTEKPVLRESRTTNNSISQAQRKTAESRWFSSLR
ncbi:mpv17-like protein isoform X2 [Orussus abietinus]|nr:mpv17-like protein isoform X2 [Orussus abietinus]XP_012273101.1 mpv17-like protein isoform X2 [Orussus abietinus]XP_012273102.1 mpv17-like protein isoform X2 [Orussus abietinus]